MRSRLIYAKGLQLVFYESLAAYVGTVLNNQLMELYYTLCPNDSNCVTLFLDISINSHVLSLFRAARRAPLLYIVASRLLCPFPL